MHVKGGSKLIVIAVLVCCAAIILSGAWYFFTRTENNTQTIEEPPSKPTVGRWRSINEPNAQQRSFQEQIDRLASLGYLQAYHEAPSKQNVTIYDANLAYDGLNFYSSGHAIEAGIMDMQGNVLHRWTFDYNDIPLITRAELKGDYSNEAKTHWRRAVLHENGEILANHDCVAMLKLDKDSNLLQSWIGEFHHHMQTMADRTIYALAKRSRHIPEINKSEEVFDDYVVVLDPNGQPTEAHSVFESFENSDYAHMLKRTRRQGELFHTNTLQVFDGKLSHTSGLFKKGNVLISVLLINTIAIIDLQKDKVVWALNGHENGLWVGMHEPVLLENGNILIFDNDWSKADQGESKVIEFNPFTKKIVWQYKGDKEHPFFSRTCGTNQRLPNGNTLITESDNGRAFEVTRDGKIVWEYVSPHRAGRNNELIATLLHMHRIDRDSVKWLVTNQKK